MQATSNGYAHDLDWDAALHMAASLDFAADQRRYPPETRTPCANPDCDALCVSLYCTETCRQCIEGNDPEPDGEPRASSVCEAAPAVPLGEAPCSMNVHIPVCGRDVLVTLRGTDELEVLQRLEQLLARYPVEQQRSSVSTGVDWCAIHNTRMRDNEKDGRHWFSHRLPDGAFCKGRKGGNHG